jgi:hypothetical protein
METHFHVAHGISGYGPDGADGFPTFDTLADALDYAREELATDLDMAHETAHGFAEAGDYESAWKEILRMEALELLRANLDPKRKSAPAYANDPAAYAEMQEGQAAEFPVAVSHSCNLYLWDCAESDCKDEEE